VPPLSQEIRRLLSLAAPVVVTQLATMMLGVVDTLMVGHVGVQTLAAAALGHVWTFGTMVFAMGVVFGIDPVVTQAHGAGDADRQGLALQRGLILALAVSVPVIALWAVTDRAMLLLGQSPELAAMAKSYAVVQIPSLPFFMIYIALRQYMQGLGVMAPAMIVAIVANLVNVVANWALIFGHLGAPPMGILGAGLATACTRVFMFVTMVLIMRRGHLTEEGWTGWSRRAFDRAGMREVFHYGWPVGLQFALEVWAFQITSLLAGRLGDAELAAHTVVLNVASVSFMLPLGVSLAAVTRVGNLLGAGQHAAAQRAAWVAMCIGAGVMTVSAVAFVVFREGIPALYTEDLSVRALAAAIFPVAAAFQLFDGTQVVGGGVLRGMGSTRPAAFFNLIGYYCLALPVAWWMTFRMGMGLRGLWWGLAFGLAIVATMLVGWVRWRGPARMAR
jgi:MATE family multidrug resistance protein